MLSFRGVPNTNIVELTVDGAVTRDDFDAVITEINSKIEDYGSVGILEEIRDIGKIPPAVVWADLRWAAGHMKNVGRAAVVCDKRWVEKAIDVMQPLTKADIRHFDGDEIAEARKWLKDGLD